MIPARVKVWSLIDQVTEAAKTLALAEAEYNRLRNRLLTELSERYPIEEIHQS
jgi:hypothetical protein